MKAFKITKKSVSLVSVIAIAFALSACSTTRHDQLANLGFATPYLEGYDDGCHSKVTAAKTIKDGFRKDPERMFKEERYAEGWEDGYEQCYVVNKSFY